MPRSSGTAGTKRPGPRPRPQLDRATILEAAIRLSARPGTDTVSVRMLGAELKADPTAIYRHFSDKDELVRAAIDQLMGEVNAGLTPEMNWRDRLRTAAELILDVMLAHPAFGAQVATLTTGGANELRAVELTLGAFRGAGLNDVDAVRYYATYSSYVLSFVGAQAAYLLVAEDQPAEESAWVADYSAAELIDHPAVAALHDRLSTLKDRDVFLTGVDIILESAAARVSRSGRLAP
jgi:AcrR family transcriptional regulator